LAGKKFSSALLVVVHTLQKKKKKKKNLFFVNRPTSISTVDRLATTAFMTEMWRGLWVVFAWQFQPKVTLNYPFEKGPVRASTLFFCRLFCILFSYRSNYIK
jgi:cytochrome bd-type quinol oxidase subunit 1